MRRRLEIGVVWGQVLHTSGATLVGVAASMVSLFITTRYLGPDGRGLYAAAIAWVGLAATLGSLSLGQVAIHHAAGRAPGEWAADVAGTCLAVALAVTLLTWALAAGGFAATRGGAFDHLNPVLLTLAFAGLPFLIVAETDRFILNAMGLLAAANRAQVVGALVGVAGVGVLVMGLGLGVAGALAAAFAGSATVAVVGLVALVRRAGRLRLRASLAGTLLRGSAQLHLNAIGQYLVAQSSVLILNHYRPPAETGYYQLAIQLFGLTLIVSGAVNTVAFGLVAQHGVHAAWPAQRRLLKQAVAAVTVLAAIAYVAAPLGIRIAAGARFLPAVPLFRGILPALIGATFSGVMASQWIGRGLFWQAALITVTVGAASVLCDFILIPRYGMNGALVSTLVSYGAAAIINGLMAAWVQRRWHRVEAPA